MAGSTSASVERLVSPSSRLGPKAPMSSPCGVDNRPAEVATIRNGAGDDDGGGRRGQRGGNRCRCLGPGEARRRQGRRGERSDGHSVGDATARRGAGGHDRQQPAPATAEAVTARVTRAKRSMAALRAATQGFMRGLSGRPADRLGAGPRMGGQARSGGRGPSPWSTVRRGGAVATQPSVIVV